MSNPILNSAFEQRPYEMQSAPMTINGTLSKLGLMAILMTVSGCATWYQFALGNFDKVNALTMIGLVVGFILAMVICFVRKAMPVLVPLYAFAEGAALAGLSCQFEAMFPGIVVKAVSLTFITLFAMIFLYSTKIIQASEKFRGTIVTATFAVMIFYLISIVLSFFNINIPMMSVTDGSMLSIGVSVAITLLAAFNLILDFDFIERGTQNFFPKEFEWYGAFGLMVTLVWLYMEVLRLLAKLNERR